MEEIDVEKCLKKINKNWKNIKNYHNVKKKLYFYV